MSNNLEFVQVETGKNIDAVVIWLHGLGADGYDFQPIVPELHLPESLSVRFIFPHAPVRPVTINGGMPMRAWYDILEMSLDRKVDMGNIQQSCEQIQMLIQQQVDTGISSDRIVLAGFSQGGVIAYQVGLYGPFKLAGVMALSTYLADDVPERERIHNSDTPFLIHHGTLDPVVPVTLAERACAALQDKGFRITNKIYVMPHSVCPEQIRDISDWLVGRFVGKNEGEIHAAG